MSRPAVSIIIPTYNEHEHIGKCLKSLLSQIKVDFEIIVVDDGSRDGTKEMVNRFSDVTLLTQKHQGPGAARNKGAEIAQGKILVFVDADMTFEPNFLVRLIKPIVKGQVKGTFSKEEYVANMDNAWARSWSLLRGFKEGRMHPEDYPDTQPVFRAILKSEFDRVSGFDRSRGYDDDWSLSDRLGYPAQAAIGAKFYHYNPANPNEIFNQCRWMAKREYRWGFIGKLVNLIRYSLPLSLIHALYLFLRHKSFVLFQAKVIYDAGINLGILESIGGKRGTR